MTAGALWQCTLSWFVLFLPLNLLNYKTKCACCCWSWLKWVFRPGFYPCSKLSFNTEKSRLVLTKEIRLNLIVMCWRHEHGRRKRRRLCSDGFMMNAMCGEFRWRVAVLPERPATHASRVASCHRRNKHTFNTPLQKAHVKRLQFHQSASCSCKSLNTDPLEVKNQEPVVLAERNRHINDDCWTPAWLGVGYHQKNLRWSLRTATSP